MKHILPSDCDQGFSINMFINYLCINKIIWGRWTKLINNINNLFVANCVQCHQAKPDDPPPKGRRNWGMQPAILGGINTKYSQDEFQRILNAGPCYMPSFDFLNQDDKSDIYTYLGSMEGFYANSKYMRSKGCRGRMKCRSW